MNAVLEQYANVIALMEQPWALSERWASKGAELLRRLGTVAYAENRVAFYAPGGEFDQAQARNHERFAGLPGRPHAFGETPEGNLLNASGVRLTDGGTAVWPVHGVFGKRLSSFGMSERGVSCESLEDCAHALSQQDRVRAVVAGVHSPGGSVLGMDLAAEALYELRQTKPVYAVADELMASAAYYWGAQADAIYTPKTGNVGSIGVYTYRVDRTRANEAEGLDVRIIKAGAHKADGHPDTPVTDAEIARIQADVDTYYEMFKAAVQRGRGIGAEAVAKLADGTVAIGQEAVDRGFIDAVAGIKEVVAMVDRRAKQFSF